MIRGCLLFISHSVNFHMFDYIWNVRHVHVFGYVDSAPSHQVWKCMLCNLDSCAGCLLFAQICSPSFFVLWPWEAGFYSHFRGHLLPSNFWLEWVNGRCQVGSEVGGKRWLIYSTGCFCQTAPPRATVTVLLGSCNHYLPYPFKRMNY